MRNNTGLNGYDFAQLVISGLMMAGSIACIILGHKGNQVRMNQYGQQWRDILQNPPKAA